MSGKKIAAICCSAVSVLLMLVLPVVRVTSLVSALGVNTSMMSMSGVSCLSNRGVAILLPLLYGIAMTVCIALLPEEKISAIICFVGVLIPVLTFQMLISSLGIFGMAIQMGEGFILEMIFSLAAAILCLMDSLQGASRKKKIEPGLSSDPEEW